MIDRNELVLRRNVALKQRVNMLPATSEPVAAEDEADG